MEQFQGVYPAVPTPFNRGGERFDEDAMRAMVDRLIQCGVHGLFITGATGEGPSIPVEERKRIIDVVLDQSNHRITVIAQTGAMILPETIEISTYAARQGVDGVAVLIPSFFLCDRKAVIDYFVPIAEALDRTPLFFYNIPARTGNDLPFASVAELRERCPNIRGIKESGNLTNLARWMELQDEDFFVFCGMDQHEYDAYKLGSRSIVASFANWLPETFVAFHEAASNGRWEEARALQDTIIQIITPAVNENLFANIKAGLRMKGVPAGYVRPPLRDLTENEELILQNHLIKNSYLS